MVRQGIGGVDWCAAELRGRWRAAYAVCGDGNGCGGGGYYGPQGFPEMRGGDVGAAKIAAQALDEAAAGRLWSECERLTGVEML